MNTDRDWQAQFEKLGQTLSERPRLASRVLHQIREQTEKQAGRRTEEEPVTLYRGHRNLRWVAAGLSTVATILLSVFWILGDSGNVAFAQVQAALREIKTVVIEHQYPDAPSLDHQVLVSSGHDLFRREIGDAVVVIQSREGRRLTLNTKLQMAQVTAGAGFGLEGEDQSPQELLFSLQDVQTNAVKSLGKKDFDGRELAGFELPSGYQARRYIWVDPESGMPVREEITPVNQDRPTDNRVVPTRRLRKCVVRYQFNVDLSDNLFSFDLPEGYKLVDNDEFQMPGFELPSRPANFHSSDYVIVPSEGVGMVRFGMTKSEVIAVWGEPDSAELFGGFTEEQQKAMDELHRKSNEENWNRFRINREMDRIVSSVKSFVRAGEALMYRSLGMMVMIRDDTGVQAFTCSHRTGIYQPFGGATDQRISMNSTLADVKRVYGQPTSTYEPQDALVVVYTELGLNFTFGNDGKMKEIRVDRTRD